MNDRFKFRFWDKETKTMQKIPMVELRHRISLDKIFADDRVIFMQCTGLKDKNGKLIYEGDIVKAKYTTPSGVDMEEICTVDFDRCAFWINYGYCAFYLDNENCQYEVIGNLYENKSLLESEG